MSLPDSTNNLAASQTQFKQLNKFLEQCHKRSKVFFYLSNVHLSGGFITRVGLRNSGVGGDSIRVESSWTGTLNSGVRVVGECETSPTELGWSTSSRDDVGGSAGLVVGLFWRTSSTWCLQIQPSSRELCFNTVPDCHFCFDKWSRVRTVSPTDSSLDLACLSW